MQRGLHLCEVHRGGGRRHLVTHGQQRQRTFTQQGAQGEDTRKAAVRGADAEIAQVAARHQSQPAI